MVERSSGGGGGKYHLVWFSGNGGEGRGYGVVWWVCLTEVKPRVLDWANFERGGLGGLFVKWGVFYFFVKVRIWFLVLKINHKD